MCAFETVIAPSWSVFEPLEPFWRHLGASKNNDFTIYIFKKSVSQPICFNNSFWRRLVPSWNVFDPSWAVLKRLGASKNSDFAAYIHYKSVFNLYASTTPSTTPFEGALYAFETVFAPPWNVFEPSWAVLKASWSKQKHRCCFIRLSKIWIS